MTPGPDDVARWMLAELNEHEGYLAQEDAAAGIYDKFGERFTYDNDRGNLAIRSDVLESFRKLSADTVVWVRAERAWRRREPGDPVGRLAD